MQMPLCPKGNCAECIRTLLCLQQRHLTVCCQLPICLQIVTHASISCNLLKRQTNVFLQNVDIYTPDGSRMLLPDARALNIWQIWFVGGKRSKMAKISW